MTRDLRSAALVSAAFHSVLIFPAWIGRPTSVRVERGPVSFEVELFSEAQISRPEASVPAPVSVSKGESWGHDDTRSPMSPTRSLEAVTGHGAFSHAASEGIQNPPPFYPWLARIRGWEGTVVLQVRVEPDGHPSGVQVTQSSGFPMLDRAAQVAIQRWKFVPAHQALQAVRSEVELPIRFQLIWPRDNKP